MSQRHGSQSLVSFKASGVTLSAFVIVKPAGANLVALWDTTTSMMMGISQLMSQGGANSSVQIAIGGCSNLIAGASVSAGAFITGTTTGLGIEDTSLGFINTATTTVPFGIGIALDAADTNSTFEVLIMPRTVRWAK